MVRIEVQIERLNEPPEFSPGLSVAIFWVSVAQNNYAP